jgi:hypothetical protein
LAPLILVEFSPIEQGERTSAATPVQASAKI